MRLWVFLLRLRGVVGRGGFRGGRLLQLAIDEHAQGLQGLALGAREMLEDAGRHEGSDGLAHAVAQQPVEFADEPFEVFLDAPEAFAPGPWFVTHGFTPHSRIDTDEVRRPAAIIRRHGERRGMTQDCHTRPVDTHGRRRTRL